MASRQKNIDELEEHLEKGEEILQIVDGAYEYKSINNSTYIRKGILTATNRKVIFFAKKLFGFDMEVFPYANISSIEHSKDFMGYRITLFASGNKTTVKWIHNKDTEVSKFITEIKTRIGKKEAVSTEEDMYIQLEKLSKLKEKGIISLADFEKKKKQLLGI